MLPISPEKTMTSGWRSGSVTRMEMEALPRRCPTSVNSTSILPPSPSKRVCQAAVGAGHELLHDLLGILHRVIRFHHGGAAALGLAVFPLGFLLLDVGRVPQHDAAQVHGGIGGIDGAPVAVFIEVGDLPEWSMWAWVSSSAS